jgi:hypothetical protein
LTAELAATTTITTTTTTGSSSSSSSTAMRRTGWTSAGSAGKCSLPAND